MSYRILADENVERQVCRYLESQGHDAVMVVDELEPGVDDAAVVEYGRKTERVVLTHDTDYFDYDQHLLFVEDRTLSAFEVARIVNAISTEVQQAELAELGHLEVVDGWL